MKSLSLTRSHGGIQGVYSHDSKATGGEMRFAVYVPEHQPGAKLPLVWFLSGLTCSADNVMEKGEYRAACAKHGLMFIAPDTSPRGADVPDDEAYDFGQGAGFYVDALQKPWQANFQMKSYIERELPDLIAREFPMADMARQGMMGHSMGGHGALGIALRNPDRFGSVSALAPIVSPMAAPWGEKALGGYLGNDRSLWRQYDACALIEDGAKLEEILIDQGLDDVFLREQLKPELLELACKDRDIKLTLRRQPGYDHSYYFISSFMAEHLGWHAERLNR